jgi:translation initiation factor IF-2
MPIKKNKAENTDSKENNDEKKVKKAVYKKVNPTKNKEEKKEENKIETLSESASSKKPKKLSLEEIKAKRKALLEKKKKVEAEKKPEIETKQEVKEDVKAKEPIKLEENSNFETYDIKNGVPVSNQNQIYKKPEKKVHVEKTKEVKPQEKQKEPVKEISEEPKGKPQIETQKPEKKDEPKETVESKQDEVKIQNLPKLSVTAQVTVRELAEKLQIKPTDLIKKLISMGVFATITQRLDPEVAALVTLDYGYELEIAPLYQGESKEEDSEMDDPSKLKSRPPVITIMGHVDHGKTTLLDALRSSNVVDTEAGQITQHIGAYALKTDKGYITILDTPGHEAFTAMRAHGVKVTDIVILVVSAVDGIMPQTIEAMNHAKAANVPIIVAINKIDLPTANVDNIKTQLSTHGLICEEWGGKVPMIGISAKKKINIDKLLELIHLQAEIMELKANPDRKGYGIVIEAKKDTKKGILATIICTKGTIKVGDPFIVGTSYGKVRALINDRGERINSISPSFPAEVLGISGDVPTAGDIFKIVESEKDARNISETRKINKKQEDLIHQKNISLLSLKSQVDQKMIKMLNIILKTDVYGSMQAIKDSLEKLSNPEVAIHVLHSAIGDVNESDIMLAKASNAIIFGFNISVEDKLMEESKRMGVEIRIYRIIYDLLDELKAAMSGMLEPEIVENIIGKAEIKQIFDLSSGKVAGSMVIEGKIARNSLIKIYRNGDMIGEGKVSGLKRFKEDAREVEKGFECGISIDGFKNYQIGDIIEAYIKEEKLRKLNV